jgi:hypothetical protein
MILFRITALLTRSRHYTTQITNPPPPGPKSSIMAALLEQWHDAIEQYYGTYVIYSKQWAQYSFTIPTTAFVVAVFAICTPALLVRFCFDLEEARLRDAQPQSCRRLGLTTRSNLQNEFDPKFSKAQPPSSDGTAPPSWKVKSIWIYPVKSCRGVELEEGTVITTGMEYDRQFSFAQLKERPEAAATELRKEKPARKWEFITQRQYRLLATVKTEMWVPDKSSERYTPHAEEVKSGGAIVLSFPYQEPGWRGVLAKLRAGLRGAVPEKRFRIPFDPSPTQIEKAGYKFEQMTIWKETASALNLSVEIPPELSTYLGMKNKLGLFRVDKSQLREVHRNAPRKEELGYQPVTGFQDAVRYPISPFPHFLIPLSFPLPGYHHLHHNLTIP